jgi:hypothetical protein
VTRGLATVALTGAVLIPGLGLLASSAYADDAVAPASATPTVDIGEPAYVEEEPDTAPDDFPSSGGWIIGGTLQEGSQTAAPPAASAPVKPVTVTAPAARPVTVVAPAQPTPRVGEATVLPFTGPGRLSVQLTVGSGLVLLGVVLTAATRPKGTLRHVG